MISATCALIALQIWYKSQVLIFLDGLCSMSSRGASVRGLVVKAIVIVECH